MKSGGAQPLCRAHSNNEAKGKTHAAICVSVQHHQTMQLKRGLYSVAPIACCEELTLSSSIQCRIVAPDDQHFATEVYCLCVVTHLEVRAEMDGPT